MDISNSPLGLPSGYCLFAIAHGTNWTDERTANLALIKEPSNVLKVDESGKMVGHFAKVRIVIYSVQSRPFGPAHFGHSDDAMDMASSHEMMDKCQPRWQMTRTFKTQETAWNRNLFYTAPAQANYVDIYQAISTLYRTTVISSA